MQDDKETLKNLNIEIGEKEDKGDRDWFNCILSPEFAFRRVNGKFDDRSRFLYDLKPAEPGEERQTQIESINLYGDRAVVTCIVTMNVKNEPKKYHNLRLFVRHQKDRQQWRLLGWANEEIK